jgi:DNA-binding GntR family transcriptional regulator
VSDEYGDRGGGREFARVADELRARMADGLYPLHSMLPPQRELAQEFGVSRDCVQRVLRELVAEGWIVQRPGRGTRVVRAQKIHSPTSSIRRRWATGWCRGMLDDQARYSYRRRW